MNEEKRGRWPKNSVRFPKEHHFESGSGNKNDKKGEAKKNPPRPPRQQTTRQNEIHEMKTGERKKSFSHCSGFISPRFGVLISKGGKSDKQHRETKIVWKK